MKAGIVVFCAVLALIGPAAAGGRPSSVVVPIGLMAVLSGDISFVGKECRDGFEAARRVYAPGDVAGAHRLRFIYSDSKGHAREGLSEFTRLLEIEHVWVVVSHKSQVVMPLNQVSLRARVPLVGLLAHPDFVTDNRYAFRFWPTSRAEARVLADKARALSVKCMALFGVEDEYALSLHKDLAEELSHRGIGVCGQDRFTPDESDFRSAISRLKLTKPDAVFVNLGAGQIGPFIKRLRQQGLRQRIFSNFWISNSELASIADAAGLSGSVYPRPAVSGQGFGSALRMVNSEAVSSPAAYCCFAGLSFVLQSLAAAPEIDAPVGLYETMISRSYVDLPDGKMPVANREADIPVEVVTLP